MSRNGGANASGGIVAANADVVQLSLGSLTGITAQKWELFGFPPGFSLPAGWTLDTPSGNYFHTAVTPPTFTVPASPWWGKILLRLTVNNGSSTAVPSAQLVDETTALSVPSAHGLKDLAPFESAQFGGVHGWASDLQSSLHSIETNLGTGAGSSTQDFTVRNLFLNANAQFAVGQTAPIINQAPIPSGTGNGSTLAVTAQGTSGTGAGGDLLLGSGQGVSAQGKVVLSIGSVQKAAVTPLGNFVVGNLAESPSTANLSTRPSLWVKAKTSFDQIAIDQGAASDSIYFALNDTGNNFLGLMGWSNSLASIIHVTASQPISFFTDVNATKRCIRMESAASNMTLCGGTGAGTYGGGAGVLALAVATTAPTTNPTASFLIYMDPADNKLKARGPSGTVTILALPLFLTPARSLSPGYISRRSKTL